MKKQSRHTYLLRQLMLHHPLTLSPSHPLTHPPLQLLRLVSCPAFSTTATPVSCPNNSQRDGFQSACSDGGAKDKRNINWKGILHTSIAFACKLAVVLDIELDLCAIPLAFYDDSVECSRCAGGRCIFLGCTFRDQCEIRAQRCSDGSLPRCRKNATLHSYVLGRAVEKADSGTTPTSASFL